MVPPEMVVAPVRPGRVLAVAPTCADAARAARVVAGADVLVTDSCHGGGGGGGDESAANNGAAAASEGRTALEAGVDVVLGVAKQAGVAHVILTGFQSA